MKIDPNIPETGEQLAKSNNGPDTCCYEYCDPFSVYKGICAYCESYEIEPIPLPQDHQLHLHEFEKHHQRQGTELVSFMQFLLFKKEEELVHRDLNVEDKKMEKKNKNSNYGIYFQTVATNIGY